MEDLLKAIANVGFPIAVAAYLLIRIESKMDSLSASINQLSTILSIKLGGNDSNKAAWKNSPVTSKMLQVSFFYLNKLYSLSEFYMDYSHFPSHWINNFLSFI